jgi:hypothetical protein
MAFRLLPPIDRSLRDMIRASLLLAVAIAFCASPAAADCDKPEPPSCTSWYDQFNTVYDLESCKRDVESYKDEVKDFAECVKEEAKDAEKELKKAADDFERRAAKGVAGQ